mmetsp:Transcript_70826/g.153821  ORF Transcript_70826/g.153821 Transcript_70826/m.153821 type:complete len:221 (-) Transcript_70826:150-812(-)
MRRLTRSPRKRASKEEPAPDVTRSSSARLFPSVSSRAAPWSTSRSPACQGASFNISASQSGAPACNCLRARPTKASKKASPPSARRSRSSTSADRRRETEANSASDGVKGVRLRSASKSCCLSSEPSPSSSAKSSMFSRNSMRDAAPWMLHHSATAPARDSRPAASKASDKPVTLLSEPASASSDLHLAAEQPASLAAALAPLQLQSAPKTFRPLLRWPL